jgi:hypothetical protein
MSTPLRFRVHGLDTYIPSDWWEAMEGPRPPEGFGCDGCSHVADYWGDYDLRPPCLVHDYHFGRDVPVGFGEANAIFRRNTRTVLRLQGAGWLLCWTLPAWRWLGVTALGYPAWRREQRRA